MMIKYSNSTASIILFLLFLSNSIHSSPENLSSLCKNGNIEELSNACGEAIAKDQEPSEIAVTYTMLAFSYILINSNDAVDKCSGILELLPEQSEITPAISLIKLLADETKIDSIDKKNLTLEWLAAYDLAFYLYELKHNSDAEKLFAYFQDYKDKITKLEENSWIKAFKSPFEKWQLWIQYGKGNKDLLPPLVASIPPASKHVVMKKKLPPPAANNSEVLMTGVNQILLKYLADNSTDALKDALSLKQHAQKNSGLYEILNFLSSSESNEEKIIASTKNHASEWAIASISMFIKYLSTLSGIPDKYKLYFYLDNFDGNAKLAKTNSAVNVWIPYSEKWRKWINDGFNPENKQNLEQLLLKYSNDNVAKIPNSTTTTTENKIAMLSEEEFVEQRSGKYSTRPQPLSLNFDDIQPDLKDYFSSLSPNMAIKEQKRLELVKKVKHYIIRILERTPYPDGIILKGKRNPEKTRKIRGVVYLANKHHIRVKKSKRSKHGKNYKWENLAFVQYEKFIDFFAQRRLKMTAVAEAKKNDIVSDAANDYLSLSLLLDWYGYYADALKFAKKTVEIKPELSEKMANLLLD